MENQFVTYEIAKKLKELGFNEWCLNIYQDGEELDVSGYYGFNNPVRNEKLKDDYPAAPLWQQVIDWFRMKHGIHINPSTYTESTDGEITGYYMGDIRHSSGEILCYGDGNYSSYERAREVGILEAIKLI